MALTESQVEEYRKKLNSSEYMEMAVNGTADKILGVSMPAIKIKQGKKLNINKTTEGKRMEKSKTLSALNDHLMERIEWLTDREVKGEELTEEIRRSEAVTKVATQVIANASLILKAHMSVDDSSGHKGKIKKLPPMIGDDTQ